MTIDRPRFRLRFISKGLQQVLLWGAFLFTSVTAQAQLAPDGTLGSESSRVVPRVLGGDQIEGGAIRGSNLFHSFSEFNVGNQQRVYFANPTGVQNILTRVTGNTLSNINGTLGVDGTANLFLLNPNGILFGQNARLDVRGSFLGTTANAIRFGDKTEFRANDSAPLLTISAPLPSAHASVSGLQFGTNPGRITVQGDGQGARSTAELIDTPNALWMGSNQTLGLIGGDVAMVGGTLKSSGGRIEVGSVDSNSLVSLVPTMNGWTFDYSKVSAFRDIELSKQATIDSSGNRGGDLRLQGRQIIFTDGALLEASTLGSELGGTLEVTASELIRLDGVGVIFPSAIYANVYKGASGNANNVIINTQTLQVRNGARIDASTLGLGNAGNLAINATDTLEVTGVSPQNPENGSRIATDIRSSSSDNVLIEGGNFTIDTTRLIVRDGAQLSTSVFGRGKAGNFTVRAESVEVTGEAARLPSGLFAQVEPFSEGQGGQLTIDAKRISISDGGRIQAPTFGNGNAGGVLIKADDIDVFNSPNARNVFQTNINVGVGFNRFRNVDEAGNPVLANGNGGTLTIETGRLKIRNRAVVSSDTRGNGNAGQLLIQASDLIEIDGGTLNANVTSRATGQGGDLTINTRNLIVRGGGQIGASSTGIGQAGDLRIRLADSVKLDNQSGIVAETQSGNGGNISLAVGNLLLLRRGSRISTTAGTAQQGGNGGNLTINAGLITAVPSENSDIRANAFRGRGGNVRINTRGLFGIVPVPTPTRQSEITASSDLGVQGQVSIAQPEVQPAQGIIELPTDVIDASNQIAQVCPRGSAGQRIGRFVVSGTGSLPPNPIEPLTGSTSIPLATIDGSPNTTIATAPTPENPEIVEAQGWIKTPDGKVALVAHAPDTTPSARPTANCSTVTQQ